MCAMRGTRIAPVLLRSWHNSFKITCRTRRVPRSDVVRMTCPPHTCLNLGNAAESSSWESIGRVDESTTRRDPHSHGRLRIQALQHRTNFSERSALGG